MRFFSLCSVLLLAACNTWQQSLVAPCSGKPATGVLGECPPCQVDDDCKKLENFCDQNAYCVHKDSSWKVSPTTCSAQEMYTPTPFLCKCLANSCDWRYY